ncbi:Hypothetical predicted protein [Cloeon dipterum]|uniref:RING-type domain-containing protein n=1 Tax=Cloeon dipterum TaxID=197152 RepID=A0A8S1CA61_9INSE|nr:Hypothetical predicted protein [Cloeon dipterum]
MQFHTKIMIIPNVTVKGTLCQKLTQLIENGPVAKEIQNSSSATASAAGDLDVAQHKKYPSNLAVCDSTLTPLPDKVRLLESDLKDWKTDCKCETNKDALLTTIDQTLPGWLLGLLACACDSRLPVLVILLFDFGERNLLSGCRNRLLLQLSNRFHEFNAQHKACTISSKISPSVTTRPRRSQNENMVNIVHMPSQSGALDAINQMSAEFSQNLHNFFSKGNKVGEGKRIEDLVSETSGKCQVLQECCICFEEARDVAFNPCGHAVCCKKCAQKLSKCPICLKKIVNKIELYFS